jgi:two-component system nitrate/nitrite response regulator NarL
MTAADVSGALASIKDKVSGKGESDPVLAAIVKKYRLTRRESDILGCLRRRMSNPEIAADLFLSEETVKIHVRNLMKKLPVETRAEVAEWAGRFGEEGVRSM